MSAPSITFYTAGAPNGHKISIALEILNLKYKLHIISIANNEQKAEWFLKINPNGRIPAIVDHSNGDFAVFESGAILLYLAEHYDPENKLLPKDAKLRSEAIQWMAGVGPMLGQAAHFHRFAPEKIPYSIKRYDDESARLLSVIESRLQGKDYLVGNQFTVAEISLFPWVRAAPLISVSLKSFPAVEAWIERLEQHPAFSKGLDVPEKNTVKELIASKELAEKQAVEATA